ncbi:MAG: response regulator [Candidatus Omnitrophica bacterium]|nr:response regulator [Candidatus Omnitrophota bacterium]
MRKRPRLLVVDNEIDICNFVKSFFQVRGFKVVTALNGDEAMEKLAAEKPDIVILDIMMRTAREGLDYLPKIKKALPSAKVLMITAVEDNEAIDTAKKMGADDYITKPLVLEYLETTVLEKIKSLRTS